MFNIRNVLNFFIMDGTYKFVAMNMLDCPQKPAEACCTTMRGDQCSAFHRDRLWDTTYYSTYVHTTTMYTIEF